jgi:hypothetical protein
MAISLLPYLAVMRAIIGHRFGSRTISSRRSTRPARSAARKGAAESAQENAALQPGDVDGSQGVGERVIASIPLPAASETTIVIGLEG